MADKVLKVIHRSQKDNSLNPSGSCNVTSMAMALSYMGVKGDGNGQLEDQFYRWMEDNGLSRHSPQDLQVLANRYRKSLGIGSSFHYWSIQDIVKAIDKGSPVVAHGYFTSFGHIVCIVGYNPVSRELIVHDPWGEWTSRGYQHYPRAGMYSRFTYGTFEKLCCDPGNPKSIWCHQFFRLQ